MNSDGAQFANAADRHIILVADEGFEDEAADVEIVRAANSTRSLNSSIFDHRFENGRTYHKYKDGKYTLPNDETETERLDLQHHLFRLTFNGRLANAPSLHEGSKVGRVLDLGCGTGLWAIELADEHPEAEIIGVDLSPIQPEFIPANVMFEIDDIEEGWTWSKPFDYIHSRMMNSNIGDWDEFVAQAYDNLNPGGWLELNECDIAPISDDGSLRDESAIVRSKEEVDLLMERCRAEFADPNVHAYFSIWSVYGQKPIAAGHFNSSP
ncbi:Secondary metabolism regulator LAE1 [Colletotrichum fructicola]|nr:Secondary metabolism regulator LAE1 [Colletotrichum fructicola]